MNAVFECMNKMNDCCVSTTQWKVIEKKVVWVSYIFLEKMIQVWVLSSTSPQ